VPENHEHAGTGRDDMVAGRIRKKIGRSADGQSCWPFSFGLLAGAARGMKIRVVRKASRNAVRSIGSEENCHQFLISFSRYGWPDG